MAQVLELKETLLLLQNATSISIHPEKEVSNWKNRRSKPKPIENEDADVYEASILNEGHPLFESRKQALINQLRKNFALEADQLVRNVKHINECKPQLYQKGKVRLWPFIATVEIY